MIHDLHYSCGRTDVNKSLSWRVSTLPPNAASVSSEHRFEPSPVKATIGYNIEIDGRKRGDKNIGPQKIFKESLSHGDDP